MLIAVGLLTLGSLLGLRYILLLVNGDGDGHIQSLILASILIVIGSQAAVMAFFGDMMSANRRLLEEIQFQARLQLIHSKNEGKS